MWLSSDENYYFGSVWFVLRLDLNTSINKLPT